LTRTFADLRIASSELLGRYLYNCHVLVEHGNGEFARYMAEAEPGVLAAPLPSGSPFASPWVLFHSWREGFVEIDDWQAIAVSGLITTGVAVTRIEREMVAALDQLGWLDVAPVDLVTIARRTRNVFIAMQNLTELGEFLARVQHLRPRVILEIGTARGGLLYALAQVADANARLISIDLPGALNGGGQFDFEREVFASFAATTQEVVCIVGDSHTPRVSSVLDEVLDGSEIDLLVIDGDHSYEGVRSDLVEFGRRVHPSGLVALHDICLMPEVWGQATGVGRFWRQLRSELGDSLESIIDPHGVSLPQRPAHVEWSWGFGLLRGDQARAWSMGQSARGTAGGTCPEDPHAG